MQILSPVALPVAAEASTNRTLNRPIDGVRVGLKIDYAWNCYTVVIDEWETLLRADGAIPVTLWVEKTRNDTTIRDPHELERVVEEWAKLVDCGVVGLGNWGSCTAGSVLSTVEIAERGLPAVTIVTGTFETLARNMREHHKHPDLPLLVLPRDLENKPEDEVRRVAREAYPAVLELLGVQR